MKPTQSHLIAASQDMYEALFGLIDFDEVIENFCCTCESTEGACDLCTALEAARKALAKAERS